MNSDFLSVVRFLVEGQNMVVSWCGFTQVLSHTVFISLKGFAS